MTPLTNRERQVVRLLSLGCNTHEVGAILRVSHNTVDNFRARAMKKLGVNKVALLTRVAIRERISKLTDKLTAPEKRRRGKKRDGWN